MRFFAAVVVLLVLCSAFTLKKGDTKVVYVFGVSASFTDTTVYYTPIQELDSVKLTKEGFLPHRDLYSYQLKNYMEEKGVQRSSTSMVYFSDKKAKLEKEQAKLLDKYKKNKRIAIRSLAVDEFHFLKVVE